MKPTQRSALLEREIIIKASNEYKDVYNTDEKSIVVDHKSLSSFNSYYRIPKEVMATKGVSGYRWMSLTIGDKKFCYRGNGFPGPGVTDGDRFILKGAYEGDKKDCHQREFKKEVSTKVFVNKGDELKASLHGRVCLHFCELTSVNFPLLALNDSSI
jgi:hypothetical protein